MEARFPFERGCSKAGGKCCVHLLSGDWLLAGFSSSHHLETLSLRISIPRKAVFQGCPALMEFGELARGVDLSPFGGFADNAWSLVSLPTCPVPPLLLSCLLCPRRGSSLASFPWRGNPLSPGERWRDEKPALSVKRGLGTHPACAPAAPGFPGESPCSFWVAPGCRCPVLC